jgi:hypothetical protein
MEENGQSAIEFIILVGAALFFLAAFLLVVQLQLSDRSKAQKDVVLNEIAFQVQDELVLASEASDGYSRTFVLSETIIGLQYDIDIDGSVVYVRTQNGAHALTLPVVNVTGNVLKGVNLVRNVGGEVFLN